MSSLSPLRACTALAVAAGIGFASAAPAQAAQPVSLVIVDVHAVALGYRASQLIGQAVYNDHNQQIGKLDDLIVGRDRVLFAIVGVGGFLGLGQHLIAVPYTSLRMTPNRIVLPGGTKQALLKLPEFHYLH